MDIAHLRAVFTGDTSNLDRAFDSADRKIKSFAARWTGQPKVSIYGDDSPLAETLRAATAKLNAWAAKRYSTTLDADSSGFNRTFSEASRMGQHSMGEVNQAINGTRASAAKGISINVGSQGTSQTVTQLAGVGSAAIAVDRTDPKISVSTNGVVKSTGELLTLHKVVQMVHQRSRMSFTANIDRNLSMLLPKVLGDSLHVLKSLETVGAAIHAIMVPSLIGALGGLGAAFVPVAGAAVSLAVGLGEGLAGAIGAVGMAAGLGGTALVGWGAAAISSLDIAFGLTQELNQQRQAMDNSNKAVDAAKQALAGLTVGSNEYMLAARGLELAQQNAAFEQAKMNAMLSQATPAIQILIGAANNLQLAWIKAAGAIGNEMAPTLTTFINYATDQLPGLTGHAIEMARGMDQVAISFLYAATSGQNLVSIQTILLGIKAAGVPAMQLVTNAVLLLINTLAPLVPYGLRVLNVINQWVYAAAQWSATAQGQRAIGETWAYLMQQALLLGTAIVNVGSGLWGIIQALRQAGIIDYVVQGFVNLTAQFASFTAVGTEGQSRLTAFFATTKPILEALGRLFGEAVYQAYRIITAITGIETAAPGLSGIVGIIDAVTASLEPIANLIINNFTKLAPLIAPLITNIAKLAEVFLAAISPLLLFVKGLNYVFTWFTSLDPATQRLIAGIVSWVIVLGKLGILTTVIGWLGGFFGVITGISGVVTGLVTKIPLIGGALALLTGPIGIAVAVIAGLVAIGYALYTNWDSIRAMFDGPVGQSLTAFKDRIVDLAQNGLSWLITKAQEVYNWFLTNWPVWKDTIITNVQAVWAVIGPMWTTVVTFVINGANQILNWFQTNWPLIQQTVSTVWNQMYTVISTVMNAIWAVIQPIWNQIVTFWNTNHEQIKAIVSAAWTIISTVISTVMSTIGNIIVLAMQVINGDWAGAWETVKTIVFNTWESIKAVISAAGSIIWNLVQIAWNQILNTTSAIWNGIWSVINGVWQGIKNSIASAVGYVVSYLYGQWQSIKNSADYYWNALWTGIDYYANAIYNSVVGKITPILDWLTGKWKAIHDGAQYYWDLAWKAVDYYAESIYNSIVTWISDLANWLYSKWKAVYDGAMYWWNSLASAINNPIATMKSAIDGLGTYIITSIRNNFNSAVNAGLTALQNMLLGAQSFLRRIGVNNVADWIQGGIDYLQGLKTFGTGGIVEMASGGTINSGGFSGGSHGIRAITGEAGTEAVIAKNMPKATQMGFLQTAASWFNSMVVPKAFASGGFSGNGTISRPNVTFNRSRASGPSMGNFNVAINVNGADYADREALIEGIRSMAHDEFTVLMNTMLNGAGQRRASMARGF